MSAPKGPYDNTLAGTSELTQESLERGLLTIKAYVDRAGKKIAIVREEVGTQTREVPEDMWERLGFTPEEIEAGNKP